MIRKLAIAFVALALAGCATPPTGSIPNAVEAVAEAAGIDQLKLDAETKLGRALERVLIVAEPVAEIANTLGIDPLDMTAEEAAKIGETCREAADLGADATELEERMCAFAERILQRAPVDPAGELTPPREG
ncbi:MAG: hypothetical protein AAF479_10955 [Pseudomonadota bacterium]